jgi:hypothetical protein
VHVERHLEQELIQAFDVLFLSHSLVLGLPLAFAPLTPRAVCAAGPFKSFKKSLHSMQRDMFDMIASAFVRVCVCVHNMHTKTPLSLSLSLSRSLSLCHLPLTIAHRPRPSAAARFHRGARRGL